MKPIWLLLLISAILLSTAIEGSSYTSRAQGSVQLPRTVKAVWDIEKAYREKTATRERVCLNGLCRGSRLKMSRMVYPTTSVAISRYPGAGQGSPITCSKDSQTVYAHPNWKGESLSSITAAWYQREITIPGEWAGRRIAVSVEYLNSYAVVYVDGKKAGEIRFPGGEVDITSLSRTGGKHLLSMLAVAMPLKWVNLLLIGSGEEEVNAFLPMKVHMKKGEHISAYFEPSGKDSPLAGIGPADVHNCAQGNWPLYQEGFR